MVLLAALTLMPSPKAVLWPNLFEHSQAEVRAVLGQGKALGSKNEAFEYKVPGFRVFRVMFSHRKVNYLVVALGKPHATCKETFQAMGIPLDIVKSDSFSGTLGGTYRETLSLRVKGYSRTYFNFVEKAVGKDALAEEGFLTICTNPRFLPKP